MIVESLLMSICKYFSLEIFCIRLVVFEYILMFCSGGEEVMFDVVGQDVIEVFEDVGYSDEVCEIFDRFFVGILKRQVWIYFCIKQCFYI